MNNRVPSLILFFLACSTYLNAERMQASMSSSPQSHSSWGFRTSSSMRYPGPPDATFVLNQRRAQQREYDRMLTEHMYSSPSIERPQQVRSQNQNQLAWQPEPETIVVVQPAIEKKYTPSKKDQRKWQQYDSQHEVIRCLQSRYSNLITYYQSYSYSANQYEEDRYKALEQHLNGKDTWQEEQFIVSPAISALLHEHNLNPLAYEVIFGNQLQRVMHKEFIDILEDTAQLRYGSHGMQDSQGITTTLTRFVDAGAVHNKSGYVDKSFAFADFCWGLLECIESIDRFNQDFSIAVAKGSWRGIKNFGYKIVHPLETLGNTAHGLAQLCKLTAGFLQDIRKSQQGTAQQNLRDIEDLLCGRITIEQLWQRDTNAFKGTCNKALGYAYSAVTFIGQNIERKKILYAAEKGAEIGTDMMLTHATCTALGSLFNSAGSGLGAMIRVGDDSAKVGAIIASSDGVAAGIAVGSFSVAQETALIAESIGSVAQEVMTAASIFEQAHILLSQAASTGSGGDQAISSGGGGSPMPPDPDEVEEAARLAELQKKFKVPITGIEEIHPNVASLSLNKIKHILPSKHNWHKLVLDPNDWDSVARLISKVLREGRLECVDKSAAIYKRVLRIGDELVEVKGKLEIGNILVGTAWIK